MKITITLPPTLAARVTRRADMRGVSVESYLLLLADWHSPAWDNDAAWLKERVRALVTHPDLLPDDAFEAVQKLVGA